MTMTPIEVDIDDLIPHRRPMRLIDEILKVDEDSATTGACAQPTWPLLKNGAANPIVLIEVVAQTAAVLGGLKARKENERASVGRGLLVAIKSAEFFIDAIPLESRIITRATSRLLLENLKEISGTARIGETVVAEITLQSVSYGSTP